MLRRRAVATAAVAVGSLAALGAGTAFADGIRGGVTGPDEGAVIASSSPAMSASFAHPDGVIDQVLLEVVSERSGERQSMAQPGNGRSSVAVEWSPQLAHNGRYELTASAAGSHAGGPLGGPEPPVSAQVVRSFFLAAPPAVPAEVTATARGGEVTVRWVANSEPDLVGYQVERAKAGSTAFRAIGITTAPRYEDDTISDPGRYVYRVIAVRQGAEDEGVASEPSAASRSVEIAAPPPTTTSTTARPGAAPGGSAGGTDGTSSAPAGSSQPPVRDGGTVDLSSFRTLVEQNTAAPPRPPGEVDPGFQQTLPFDTSAQPSDEAERADEPQMEVGLGEPLGASDSGARRSLAFVAGGLLAFVLLMATLFVRGEVNRSEDTMDALAADRP